jgi:ornithine cyclodeaminase/alanine dehydrogenase-like protein (mu-crystallin family)
VTLLISDEVVRRRFSMGDCITAVERGYRAAAEGQVTVSERASLPVPGAARLLTLSAVSGALGVAMSLAYTGTPIGADRSTSAVDRREKVYAAFDVRTGACSALVGGRTLSWLNTGAVGAVAIKHLAVPHARSLALIGAGRQARAALAGAVEVRSFDDVRVWSRRRSTAEDLAHEFAHVPGIRVVDHAQDAVSGADVVVTTTTSARPVVEGVWLAADSHVNSIGAHQPDRRELDADAVAGATVVVDTLVQARAEKGELLLAAAEGRFSFSDVHAELGDVVCGRAGRSGAGRTFFASSGSGIESLAALAGVLACVRGDDSLPRVDLNGAGT